MSWVKFSCRARNIHVRTYLKGLLDEHFLGWWKPYFCLNPCNSVDTKTLASIYFNGDTTPLIWSFSVLSTLIITSNHSRKNWKKQGTVEMHSKVYKFLTEKLLRTSTRWKRWNWLHLIYHHSQRSLNSICVNLSLSWVCALLYINIQP